jgi:hypothetical protein
MARFRVGGMRVGPRTLLVPGNLTYAGSFRAPETLSNGIQTGYTAGGFTIRRVGGQLRCLRTTWPGSGSTAGNQVYEMTVPDPYISPNPGNIYSYPQGTVTQIWTDPFPGARVLLEAPTNSVYYNMNNWSLRWDDRTGRLYSGFSVSYGAPRNDPCLCYAEISDSGGTSTAHGPWNVRNSSGTVDPVKSSGGLSILPDWFANAHCSGRRLSTGFGGPMGGVGDRWSNGPPLTAFDTPDPAKPTWQLRTSGGSPDYTSAPPPEWVLEATHLIDYGANTLPTGDPIPARRNADYYAAAYGRCFGGTAGSAYLDAGSYGTADDGLVVFYAPGQGGHENQYYPGRSATIYFPDGTTQVRTTTTYVTIADGHCEMSFDPPLSGGKVVDASCFIKISMSNGGGAVNRDPVGNVGYWTQVDYNYGGVHYVGGTNRHGFICFPTLNYGWMCYCPGGPRAEFVSHELWIYDPDDVAAMAAGTTPLSHIDPVVRATFSFPGVPHPTLDKYFVTKYLVSGVEFDPTTNLLYLSLVGAYQESNQAVSAGLIHVYEVNS